MTKPPSPRPLSVKVIAILLLASGVGGLIAKTVQILAILVQEKPYTEIESVFGILISGWPAAFVSLLVFLVTLVLGIGLWHRKELVRRVAIGWYAYCIFNSFLELFSPAIRAFYLQNLDISVATFRIVVSLAILTILRLIVIWFLIKRKSAFVKPMISSPASA